MLNKAGIVPSRRALACNMPPMLNTTHEGLTKKILVESIKLHVQKPQKPTFWALEFDDIFVNQRASYCSTCLFSLKLV